MTTITEHLEKELELVEGLIEHLAKSRMGAGILFIPDLPWDKEAPEEDEETIEQELIKALLEPVPDWNNYANLVPIIVRGPEENLEKIKLIDSSGDKEFRDMLCARAYTLRERIEYAKRNFKEQEND